MPERLTDARIDELLALEAKATPGPCEARYVRDVMPVDCVHFGIVSQSAGYETGRNWKREDAELDAASRNSIRSLLEEVRERRAADAELLEACKSAKKFLEPDLVEPGRTVFWKLVAAIARAEKES